MQYDKLDRASNREVHQFDDYDWWDPEGPLWTLHAINPIRLAFINKHIELAGKQVLDLGCGGGILTEALATCGAEVTGLDLNQQAIAKARVHQQNHHPDLDIDYEAVDIADWQSRHQDLVYDAVVCMEMLEHTDNPQSIIASCADLLGPGGLLFLSTLNRNLKSYLGAVIAGEYLLKLLPRGTHDYGKFITPIELDQYCTEAGLNLTDTAGISYNPLTKSFKQVTHLNINYMVVAEKF